MQKWSFLNAYFKCFRCWLEVSTQSPNSVQSKHTGFKDGTHCIFWQRNTPRFWMKSCIFWELIKKEYGDHRIFNTWCGDPGKVCHCYFWWWACWLFCCWALYWKWWMEINIGLIAFFKGSSTWCRPWDHRKGKPVSGNPGCRRYLAERFQLRKYSVVTQQLRSQPAGEVAPRQAEELARPRNLLCCWLQVVQFSRNIMKNMMAGILCRSWWKKYYADHGGKNIMQIMVVEILCRSWW